VNSISSLRRKDILQILVKVYLWAPYIWRLIF
jgi:hypothetical protein